MKKSDIFGGEKLNPQSTLSGESIDIIANFYGMFQTITREYSCLREELTKINQEEQDLLHEIELSPLNAAELVIVASKIRDLRRLRRQVDNEFETITPLVNFIAQHKGWEVHLWRPLNEMQKIKESLNQRRYTPRVRTDIKLYKGEELE